MAQLQKDQAIYDARPLGAGKMTVLGLQHLFAMFGATVLVPVITGLSVSATLLFAGLGTLLFHLLTKMKVPAFLGSSFAFLGGYAAVTQMGADKGLDLAQSLPYACIGVFCAGLMYFVLAGLFAAFGAKKVLRFFPPIVTGPIIIAIGLTLSGSAIQNCNQNWCCPWYSSQAWHSKVSPSSKTCYGVPSTTSTTASPTPLRCMISMPSTVCRKRMTSSSLPRKKAMTRCPTPAAR